MVRWGHGRTERWRCPPCGQKRRKKRHHNIEGEFGAPRHETPEPAVVVDDSDLTLWHGDCLDVLGELPDQSVHMCATSPPFYGLRDYGVDGQIGLEETPDEWVERLVEVFREVRRVLRDDGTFWCEIGDSYAANRSYQVTDNKHRDVGNDMPGRIPPGLKPKDLIGQPWMLAFALRADGWYLRSEVIWARPNPMPESIRDRPTKSHSTVFLLSKSPRYYYDMDAIREEYAGTPEVRQGRVWAYQQRAMLSKGDGTTPTRVLATAPPQAETLDGSEGEAPRGPDGRRVTAVKGRENSEQHRDGERWPNPNGANARSVWTIATEPTPFAHFATWPTKLVARMILAGTSEQGCCPECGAPWQRDVEVGDLVGKDRGGNYRGSEEAADASRANRFAMKDREYRPGMSYERTTTGWVPTCDHHGDPVPCTVLDPFAGSGTTLLVARSLGRQSIGVELNEDYCKLVADRTQQLSLLT